MIHIGTVINASFVSPDADEDAEPKTYQIAIKKLNEASFKEALEALLKLKAGEVNDGNKVG